MRYTSDRNIYVRINRLLEAHGTGQKLRKNRSRSTDAKGCYYLELPDGSVVENVELEQLARRLGCLKKQERVGIPPRRTGAEAKVLIDELATEMAASRATTKAVARGIGQFARFIKRFE